MSCIRQGTFNFVGKEDRTMLYQRVEDHQNPAKLYIIKHTPASENVQSIKNKGEFKGRQISTN